MATDGVAVFILRKSVQTPLGSLPTAASEAPPLGGGHRHADTWLSQVALTEWCLGLGRERSRQRNVFSDSSAFAGEADPSTGRTGSRIVVSCSDEGPWPTPAVSLPAIRRCNKAKAAAPSRLWTSSGSGRYIEVSRSKCLLALPLSHRQPPREGERIVSRADSRV